MNQIFKKNIQWDFNNKNTTLLKWDNVHTVCEESRCPNRYECSKQGIATYLIGGGVCTRACKFCHIATGRPKESMSELMQKEEKQIIHSVTKLNNRYVVITSVARDDDEIGLARHFSHITKKLNKMGIEVELLIPDFHLREDCLNIIAESKPLVIGHNIETVENFSSQIRPQANYQRSLKIHRYFHQLHPNIILKAGMMIGLGETMDQIRGTLLNLKDSYVEIVTIGQYLQPSSRQVSVKEYISQNSFLEIENLCRELGFSGYEVGPFVRSSYMASRTMEKVRKARMQRG